MYLAYANNPRKRRTDATFLKKSSQSVRRREKDVIVKVQEYPNHVDGDGEMKGTKTTVDTPGRERKVGSINSFMCAKNVTGVKKKTKSVMLLKVP